MGYDTQFKGELKFTTELTRNQLRKINTLLGEDCREHPEWNRQDLTHIDLELSEYFVGLKGNGSEKTYDFVGLKWNGSEKTYDLVEKVNLIIEEMQKEFPNFGLTGELKAQGADIDDRWYLKIIDNKAIKVPVEVTGKKITCPHCGEEFTHVDQS